MGGDDQNPVHENGVSIKGAFFCEKLDLSATSVLHRICFSKCAFQQIVCANGARIVDLGFLDCTLGGILANGLHARLIIIEKTKVIGAIDLQSSELAIGITISNSKLLEDARPALNGDGMKSQGEVVISNSELSGACRFMGAKIGSDLNLTRSKFSSC